MGRGAWPLAQLDADCLPSEKAPPASCRKWGPREPSGALSSTLTLGQRQKKGGSQGHVGGRTAGAEGDGSPQTASRDSAARPQREAGGPGGPCPPLCRPLQP